LLGVSGAVCLHSQCVGRGWGLATCLLAVGSRWVVVVWEQVTATASMSPWARSDHMAPPGFPPTRVGSTAFHSVGPIWLPGRHGTPSLPGHAFLLFFCLVLGTTADPFARAPVSALPVSNRLHWPRSSPDPVFLAASILNARAASPTFSLPRIHRRCFPSPPGSCCIYP